MKSANQPLWIPHDDGKPSSLAQKPKGETSEVFIPFGGKQLIS